MIFSIVIYASPSTQASQQALAFAQALLKQGHSLYRVFFYGEGVYNTSALLCPPSDEPNPAKEWQRLQKAHNLDLVTCIAAGLKRGITDQAETSRNNLSSFNLMAGCELSGLGQLLDASVQSDRVITFA